MQKNTWKIQQTFMIKIFQFRKQEKNCLKLIKEAMEKPVNIIFNGECLNALLLRWKRKQKHPLLPLLFNIILEDNIVGKITKRHTHIERSK